MSEASQRQSVTQSEIAARYEPITYKVIGAAMRVHNALGPGLKEMHYHNALTAELRESGLSFEDEKPLEVTLPGERIGLLYIDHFVEDAVVIEEKAFSHLLTNEELAQVLTYLAVSGAPIGLLINFGRKRLEYKRILPPKKFEEWRKRAARYAWRPDDVLQEDRDALSAAHPLIRSTSAGEKGF